MSQPPAAGGGRGVGGGDREAHRTVTISRASRPAVRASHEAAGAGGQPPVSQPSSAAPDGASARRASVVVTEEGTGSGGAGATGSNTRSPPPPSTTPPAPQTGRLRVSIDRAAFGSINFSAPLLVNNLSSRVLFPALMRHRANVKRAAASSSSTTTTAVSGGWEGSEGAALKASDGSALFSSLKVAPGARSRFESSEDGEPVDYRAIAGKLCATLEESWSEVSKLLAEEETMLQRQEVRCKRVEIDVKRQLATVRLGLEATTTRLQAYEDRVSNAQAATAGIEQHLSQSNARVQRGKSVSQLLHFFRMFTSIGEGQLSGILKGLSRARVAQRTAVTDKWERGRVSPFNPRYFTTLVDVAAMGGGGASGGEEGAHATKREGLHGTVSPPAEKGSSTTGEGPPSTSPPPPGSAAPRRPQRSVFRRGARRAGGLGVDPGHRSGDPRDNGGSGSHGPPPHSSVGAPHQTANIHNDPEDLSSSSSSEDSVDEAGDNLMNVKLHRAEAAAAAAGLDRMFAVRSCTEAQVEWCQKLLLLAGELGTLSKATKAIEAYVAWLRQELVADLFHVISRFNDFYARHSQSAAVHMGYGRALLKTMELVARLYATLTPSNDALLREFFAFSVNDLGVALFSEYSPRPLPSQPPLPAPTPMLAMDHFRQHTDGELRKSFHYLVEQVRRDVTVVETVFGMTNTSRQQLLSRVTEGVVKRFIEQQVKLAETYQASILASEGSLSPRSKRRCGARVADAVAYHHTVEVRLFVFFQSFIEELKQSFEASEVEFLNRFTEVIFANRVAYSTSRTELHLLERYYTLIEETYTRHLHPIPDECFDLREAHMQKAKDLLDRLTEVTTRVKAYAMPKDVGPYVLDIVTFAMKKMAAFLDTELSKALNSVRGDRDSWRQQPKSEEELLKPAKPESQQCGLRMLLFAQSSLMSLNDCITVICMPLLQTHPRLMQDIDDTLSSEMEGLDERAERLLNMCAQAIVVRSLSILPYYQGKNDYSPKDNRNKEQDTIAPPCTRACTVFCYYVTRQFEEAKEFIRLSNGQVPQRPTASQVATGANPTHATTATTPTITSDGSGGETTPSYYYGGSAVTAAGGIPGGVSAVRARARTMNMQQLVYGDGGPSSFVRTVGVCLFQGISAHLKSFTINDRGALVYKQDVTAYKECMNPLTSTPGLGGAVVETLFQLLKETSSLLIMPLDHIKDVKESGTLRLMTNEEKLKFIRIRQDVQDGLRPMESSTTSAAASASVESGRDGGSSDPEEGPVTALAAAAPTELPVPASSPDTQPQTEDLTDEAGGEQRIPPAAPSPEPLTTSDPFVLSLDEGTWTGQRQGHRSTDTSSTDLVQQGAPPILGDDAGNATRTPPHQPPQPEASPPSVGPSGYATHRPRGQTEAPSTADAVERNGGGVAPPRRQSPAQPTPQRPINAVKAGSGAGDGGSSNGNGNGNAVPSGVPSARHAAASSRPSTGSVHLPRRAHASRPRKRYDRNVVSAAVAPLEALHPLLDAPSTTHQEEVLKEVVKQMMHLIDVLEQELTQTRADGAGSRSDGGVHGGAPPRRQQPQTDPPETDAAANAGNGAHHPHQHPRRGREQRPVTRHQEAKKGAERRGKPHYMEATYTINQRYRYPSTPPSPSREHEEHGRRERPTHPPRKSDPTAEELRARPPPPTTTRCRAPVLRTASRAEERTRHELDAPSNDHRTASANKSHGTSASAPAQQRRPSRPQSAPDEHRSRTPPPRSATPSAEVPHGERQKARPAGPKPSSSSPPAANTASAAPAANDGHERRRLSGRGNPPRGRDATRTSSAQPRSARQTTTSSHAHRYHEDVPDASQPRKDRKNSATRATTVPMPIHLHTAERASARPPPPPPPLPPPQEQQPPPERPQHLPTSKGDLPLSDPDFTELQASYWAQSKLVLQQLSKMLEED